MPMTSLSALLKEIRKCDVCAVSLPEGPRPVLAAHRESRILIIGQAPGRRVHASGVPWDDPSGDRLRHWLGVDRDTFYDPRRFALVPMGFCYPGTGKSGDLPPRPECADLWHERVLRGMPDVSLTLLLSRFAHARYLADSAQSSVTATVRAWNRTDPSFPQEATGLALATEPR